MIEQFEICEEKGKRVILDKPVFAEDGWLDKYRLTLESPNMRAVMEVENPPYGALLSEYFSTLAEKWDGWEGEKEWGSLDGEFSITSTMSKQGHAKLKIIMNVYGSPSDWVAIAELNVEAGQLEKIAKGATKFFVQERI